MWSLLTDSSTKVSHLSPKQEFLWTVCAFYVTNINVAIKSVLTAFLATPLYVETITTLKDMVKSDLRVLYVSVVDSGIENTGLFSQDESSQLRKRVLYCNAQFEHCLTKVYSSPHYCWTTYQSFIEFLRVVLPNRKYHILNPPIGIGHNTIFTRKNFFLTRKLSMAVLRAAQAGLIELWNSRFLRNYKICDVSSPDWMLLKSVDAERPILRDFSAEPVHPLNMHNLYSPFRVLASGLSFAMVVLVVEVLSAAEAFSTFGSCYRRYFLVLSRRQLAPFQYVN